MIPEIVFDTEEFQEIFEEARGKIASIYPEWTDYNYHDPGITMLELFSWMKEGQQFYMEQTGEEQQEKFLKLLGTRRLMKQPARAMLTMDIDNDMVFPKGTKFYADSVCYEAIEQNYILKEDITKCFYARNEIREYIDRRQLEFGHKLKLYMFGNEPQKDDTFYIGLQESLPCGMEISIYFDLFTEYEVERNPLEAEPKVPFARFCVEYLTENGWKEVKGLRDTTFGFLQDGQIFFQLEQKMVRGRVFEDRGYFIRLRLEEGMYDVAPVLTGFGINILEVVQTEHITEHCEVTKIEQTDKDKIRIKGDTFLSIYGGNDIYVEKDGKLYEIPIVQKYMEAEKISCFFVFELPKAMTEPSKIHIVSFAVSDRKVKILGEGNGYPSQTYLLYDELVEYESFGLMVQEEDSEAFTIWERVQDFAGSTPEDKHYVLDSREGIVRFGNSIHGLAPCGEIRIISYVRTLGSNGKVKTNKINRLAEELGVTAVLTNTKNSWGGRREETFEESFIRIQKELKHPLTAVTYEDYENVIRKTPGLMIASCKVLTPPQVKEYFPYFDESAITVVVKPYARQVKKELMHIYRKNILEYMEQFRMTGTSVYLVHPEYIEFDLYVEVAVKTHYIHGEEEVKATVEQYFQAMSKDFGGCVVYSKLYGVIDMLPCVKQMRALSFEVRGTGVKHLADQSVQVPPHGVVELSHVEYQFTIG